ncbi:AAA domain-containing protein [Scenedesmus sp. NREL 46B-D3]|nr:AAA domain-containing protein [Scenedesmus sp. NREL 46B-D3]
MHTCIIGSQQLRTTHLDRLVPPLQVRLKSAVEAEQQHEAKLLKSLYAGGSLRRLQKDGLVLLRLQECNSPHQHHGLVLLKPQWLSCIDHTPRQQAHRTAIRNARHGSTTALRAAATSPQNRRRQCPPVVRCCCCCTPQVRKDHLLLTVDKSDSDLMQRALAQAPAAAMLTWRLDQSVRDTTARRQLEAIARLARLRVQGSPFELLLRACLVGVASGHYIASLPPLWVRDAAWRADVRALLGQLQHLNNSQKKQARSAAGAHVAWRVVQSRAAVLVKTALMEMTCAGAQLAGWMFRSVYAAGVGKVLIKASIANASIANRLNCEGPELRWRAMGPLLACADTNAAVDNLVEGLAGKGLQVVRLGQPAKRAAALREASKALFERAKLAAEGSLLAWGSSSSSGAVTPSSRSSRSSGGSRSPAAAAKAAASRRAAVGLLDSESLEADARRKWGQAEALSREAGQLVLAGAHVVCATCAGAGDPMLNDLHFNVVVIDEATQASEPATLVPLTQGAQCAVMAGDPCQLPPTIISREAYKFDLDVTLFDRLQQGVGLAPLLLDTQYRMNPAISRFPRWGLEEKAEKSGHKLFLSAASLSGRHSVCRLPWFLVGRLVYALAWSDTQLTGLAEQQAGDAATGAILTPYKGQVRALEYGLRVLAPWFEGLAVSVSSVDSYQGREADVIVFSAVRCNSAGKIGFVSDPRRLNVAITRPRRGLVVVCSPDTLSRGSSDWAAFVGCCEEQGWLAGPQQLPAAPWQEQGVDPFAARPVDSSSSGGGDGDGRVLSSRGAAAL